jgi:hypothetical protein
VGAGLGVAVMTEAVRSVTVPNVVYREIVDYQRVFVIVLAYRTRERAPAVLAFIETRKRTAHLTAYPAPLLRS